ncbi:MAG: nodulation protein S NodS [Flavobacteriaceae bacterium]|nr:nodulation protein S NodS [Flavobacteriaceae bacterium]|tara:strand:+ start:53024 stop:53635 length:612 start_codon:yes stop_codon:yes gene_type:complete
MKRAPIEVFSDWAENGRDIGMEKGHENSVTHMLNFATKGLNNFSFIDAGCGNGWAVRIIGNNPNCKKAIGIDGSKNMIKKAKDLDKKNTYIYSDLMKWKPKIKIDIVHSMEVFYYFQNPEKLIKHINRFWLKQGGRIIIGIDYYKENKASHCWPEECGISIMQLLSEKEWNSFFKIAGFKNVKSWRVGEKDNWSGTLVLTGTK